jgi:hypothetical protein
MYFGADSHKSAIESETTAHVPPYAGPVKQARCDPFVSLVCKLVLTKVTVNMRMNDDGIMPWMEKRHEVGWGCEM